nr:Ty3/gypsy retrotransposon protein [Ipomoea batatas]
MKYFDNSATIWTEHNNKGGQCSTSPINNPAMHQPKLAPRYFGPFIIVRKLSTLSYKLALPATTKAAHKQSGNTQVLVQWEGQPKDDTTWVDIADFRGQFPNSNLVDKVVSLAGSIDKERNQWIVYTRKCDGELWAATMGFDASSLMTQWAIWVAIGYGFTTSCVAIGEIGEG